uniref:Leucine-rich repeat-containing protein 51 n=1 Tax=Cyprinus carpio TaxID=7962 RepID=A0A8C2DW88_CYPCA
MSGGRNMFGSPVDFSFRELNTVSDMLSDEPNPGARPLKRDSEQKILSATLRLNNNFLSDLTGLMDTLSALYAEPTRLAWLDLSFNEFQHIHPVLTELKELRLLYLHGNRICKLSEVDKLAALPFLHTITLHGNPIVTEREYRYGRRSKVREMHKSGSRRVSKNDNSVIILHPYVIPNLYDFCATQKKKKERKTAHDRW